MIYRINLLILLVAVMITAASCAPEAALKMCKVKLGKGKYASDPLIRIPVTVGDSTYDFIFDTGGTLDKIDTSIVKNVRLRKGLTIRKRVIRTDSVRKETVTFYHPYRRPDSLQQKYALRIDSFPMQGSFRFADGYNVIGKKTIQHYSWLFDFSADTVTISNGDIPLPIRPSEEVLTLKWKNYGEFRGNSKVKMTIWRNKRIKCTNTHFDTGFSRWLPYNRDTLVNIDMLFTNALMQKILNAFVPDSIKEQMPEQIEKATSIDIRNMWVNGVMLENFGVQKARENGAHYSYITSNFARRFRLMYIDKKRGQVQLIGRNPHYERMVNRKRFTEYMQQVYGQSLIPY
jgi:hypothetical protein